MKGNKTRHGRHNQGKTHRIVGRIALVVFVVSFVAFLIMGGNFVREKYLAYQQQREAIAYLDRQTSVAKNIAEQKIKGSKSSINIQDSELKLAAALVVPKINLSLPVFNDNSTTALDIGAGWQPGSSPIGGGKNTHAVIDGHSGKTATLFTHISKLKKGDPIYLKTAAGKILEYKVVSQKVYVPTYTTDLLPQANKDLLTLITCYPLYQNTHRLHVTAKRVPYDGKYQSTGTWLDWIFDHLMVVAGVALLIVVFGTTVAVILYRRKKERDSWTVIHYDGRRIQ